MELRRFVLKDDQEPSIKALREAVIRRITALKGDLDIQVTPEESPVGESESNGEVESAIKQVQGQFRTVRLSLQSSYQQIVPDDHVAALWLLPHSAQLLHRYLVGQEGKTARQRLRGRTFKSPVVEFGECVWYLRLKNAGKDRPAAHTPPPFFYYYISQTGWEPKRLFSYSFYWFMATPA